MEDGTTSPSPTSGITPAKKKVNPLWVLYGIIGSLLLALIILAVLFGIFLSRPIVIPTPSPTSPKNTSDVGYSPAHLLAMSRLQSTLNPAMDPCVDFYEYTCGKALADLDIPESGASIEPFGISARIQRKMNKLLRSTETSSSQAIEKVKIFHKSCLNHKEDGQKKIQDALGAIRSAGGFPLLGYRPSESPFNWSEYILYLAKMDIAPKIFDLGVQADLAYPSRIVLKFGPPSRPFPVPWTNETVFKAAVEAYKKKTKKILEMFAEDAGLPANPHLDQELEDLYSFYRRLASLSNDRNALKMSQKSAMGDPVTDLEGRLEKFSDFVNRVEQKTGLNLRHLIKSQAPDFAQDFLSDENLDVRVKPNLEDELATLVRETSPDTWKNYYQLDILESYVEQFPQKYTDVLQEFDEILEGRKEKIPRWKKCLEVAVDRELYPAAYSALYVRKLADKETKREVEEMTENVRQGYSQLIREADWLDEETMRNALTKLEAMVANIGYNDDFFDDRKLDDHYKDLQIHENMTYQNMSSEYGRWKKRKIWEKAMQPFDRSEFHASAAQVNALHIPPGNVIEFLWGILQSPFFDRQLLPAFNYGGIGMVLGHEMGHGFDNFGILFDETGKLRNWWTKSSSKNFDDRAKAMVEQYNNYEIKEIGIHANGQLTLGENIADNSGIQAAYRAYKKYLEKTGGEKRVPGFDFSNEQLFFLGYGQVWCSKATPELMRFATMTDEHSINKARINVVLSNQPEFAKAFNCPIGSPMNPHKKVTVW